MFMFFLCSSRWQDNCFRESRMARNPEKPERHNLSAIPQKWHKYGSGKLMLHGVSRKPIEQSLENAQPTGNRLLRGPQDIASDRIACANCEAQRMGARIAELEEEVDQLQLRLALVTGRLVPENRLPC
jgi:hypothetical protein